MAEIIAACIVAGAIALAALAYFVMRRTRAGSPDAARLRRAQGAFAAQRSRLQTACFRHAAASGKPRGLRWTNCDFDEAVTFAKDRRTGALVALVGVTISFEAIEGGEMEEVEAVGNLRAGTVIFAHTPRGWQPTGRVLFNLDPQDALARAEWELEEVHIV